MDNRPAKDLAQNARDAGYTPEKQSRLAKRRLMDAERRSALKARGWKRVGPNSWVHERFPLLAFASLSSAEILDNQNPPEDAPA
jgi:hypothetical protein